MTETVWVTGAAGFTGRFMIQHLRQVSPSVRIVGLDITGPSVHDADAFLEADLCVERAIDVAINTEPPDVVIHLAGLLPPQTESDMRRVNVGGSVKLAQALLAVQRDDIRLISAGSAAEYLVSRKRLTESSALGGNSAYGRTKREQSEKLLKFATEGLLVIVARPFNLLGPGLSTQLVAGSLCEQFVTTGRSDGFIAPKGPTTSVRDFIDVRDVVAAYWTLAQSGTSGQVYNVCTGRGTTIATVIDVLAREFGLSVEVRPDFDTKKVRDDVSIGDNRKLIALGWRPVCSLDQSLRSMVRAVSADES